MSKSVNMESFAMYFPTHKNVKKILQLYPVLDSTHFMKKTDMSETKICLTMTTMILKQYLPPALATDPTPHKKVGNDDSFETETINET